MSLFQSAFDAHQAGRLKEAEDGYRQVLEHEPRHADALHLLGLIHSLRGDTARAEALIREALSYYENPVFLCNLANVFLDQARHEEAEALSRRALELDPYYFLAHHRLGTALMGMKRPADAEAAFRRALDIDPRSPDALNNLAMTLSEMGRHGEAEAAYLRALEIDPHHVHALYNLGLRLLRADRFDEAAPAFTRALAVDPTHADAANNLGTALSAMGRLREAEAAYRDVIARNPTFADAHWNLAILLLKQGRYAEGWPHGEFRNHPQLRPDVPRPAYTQWRGEPLHGKSLAIWPEQGNGDYIQFARYVPLLKARGAARITLICPAPLKPLFATLDGVDEIATVPSAVAPHDYWSFLMSLPLHCGTTVDTIPAQRPYLRVLPERLGRWRNRLPARGPQHRLRVGLVWRGFAGHQHDGVRSLPGLATLAPLWWVPGATFVSLQKDESPNEVMLAGTHLPLVRLGPDIADFADTAAIVSELDLVVCVDTAVAHLAGALGKPCWVMLSKHWTDWRWLRDRDDSPWYPNVRLFRQTRHGDWRDVVERIAIALRERIAAQPAA
ncbi:tetratricopeptide repeat protein [Paraburkholderia sp.]|uniref:tetratricopeptide repeat protein n=1 Tax=Paraburkholderia sp. TaxID=1926495 RepID=UPI003D6FFF08